ncbi:recombinase family protein [Paraglaciecola chathamensis]|uniref:recombinase family protein n=1 Tax=Paraglaciecola chathamensis TaxID=368405 RepID=UPI0026FEE692|nr:recombinase family protein [Paraglaciecola chathamensis]MDO6842083.1 recombinase family protein [Paraglaciecola chathamensis]
MELKYVTYVRVSTKEQGKSGLGLDAQRRDIKLFLDNYTDKPYQITAEHIEVHSGTDNTRPELSKAICTAKERKAILLIAKLDRLSRKVSFIAGLMDDENLSLQVAQMPNADKFQLHIYAALAEQERDFISKRTIAALKEAKLRGVKLGGLRDKTNERNKAKRVQADHFAARMWRTLEPMQQQGLSLSDIANRFNEIGITTVTGKQFQPQTIKNIIRRCSKS